MQLKEIKMKQLELKYSFDALEPYIDALTMETHYSKHHKTYTDNLINAIVNNNQLQNRSIEDLLTNLDKLPKEVQATIRNNGGGYYNHNLFFDILSPNPSKNPSNDLLNQINKDFGSFENLKNELINAGLSQFGSGWAWLVKDENKNLKVIKTANQDTPLELGLSPILGIDVWEHGYYLKYKNLRKDYLVNIFEVIDWNKVEEYYNK